MKTFCPISFFLQAPREQRAVLASAGNHGPACSVTVLFRNLVNYREGRSLRKKNLLATSLSNMSSITTPNGPWVYTVVPWED
jgi:hypothetical protein